MLGVWNMELFFCMFKLMMATQYHNSVKTREIYRYNRMNNCLVDVCNTWSFSHCWLMFAPYEYSSMVGWCLKHMIIKSWLVDIWNIWLLSHGWLIFGIYDYWVMVGWCLEHITIQSWLVLFVLWEYCLHFWY